LGQSVKKARSALTERAFLCGGHGGVINRLDGTVAVLSRMAAGGVGALLVESHQLIVDRIDGAVGAEGAVGELAEAHADEIGLARFAFGKGDVAVVLLGYPFPAGDGLAGFGIGNDADIGIDESLAALGIAGDGRIVLGGGGGKAHLAVGVVLKALGHVEVAADEGGADGVVQSVVGIIQGFAYHFGGYRQRELTVFFGDLTGKEHLHVIAGGDAVGIEAVDQHIALQHGDVVGPPGEEGEFLSAPSEELATGTGERDPLLQIGVFYMGQLGYAEMHTGVVFGRDHLLVGVGDLEGVVQLDGADLDDLAPQGVGVGDGAFGPHGLIPFQIHDNIIHRRFDPIVHT